MGDFCGYAQIASSALAENGQITRLDRGRGGEDRREAAHMKSTSGFGDGLMNASGRREEMSGKAKHDQNQ